MSERVYYKQNRKNDQKFRTGYKNTKNHNY